MAYTVFRSDLLSGTDDASALVSCRVYDAEDNPIEVENGTLVELKSLEEGEREVFKVVLATASTPLNRLAVIGSVETMYDERKKNLDEFINEAGAICRAYIPRSRNKYAITKEGFKDGEAPEVDAVIGIADGKHDPSASTGFGVCVAIEQAGRYTYYVIDVD